MHPARISGPLAAISVGALLLAAAPAMAASTKIAHVYTSITPDDTASLLQSAGLEFVKTTLGDGSLKYAFSLGTYDVSLYANDCTDSVCESLQMYVGFAEVKVSQTKINEWNTNHRFSRAYIDSDGDPVLESDLDLSGGVTTQALTHFIRLFRSSASQYAEHIGFK